MYVHTFTYTCLYICIIIHVLIYNCNYSGNSLFQAPRNEDISVLRTLKNVPTVFYNINLLLK